MGSWGYPLIFRYDAVKGMVAPKIRKRRPENTVTIKAHSEARTSLARLEKRRGVNSRLAMSLRGGVQCSKTLRESI